MPALRPRHRVVALAVALALALAVVLQLASSAGATPPGVPTPAPPENPYPPHNLPLQARVPLVGCDDCPSGTRPERCTGWASVLSVDRVAKEVTLQVTGDISRWFLFTTPLLRRYDFPEGFQAEGEVRVRWGVPEFPNTPFERWWTQAEVFDPAELNILELHQCDGTPRAIVTVP